jgi:hypothetical protein
MSGKNKPLHKTGKYYIIKTCQSRIKKTIKKINSKRLNFCSKTIFGATTQRGHSHQKIFKNFF